MKKFFIMMGVMLLTMSFTACGGDGDDPTPTPSNVHVTPNSVSFLSSEGSSASVYIATEDIWQISGCPEWLHLSATSGKGGTSVMLTTKSENFSASARTATLTVSTSSSQTTFDVSQDKYFSEGLEVSVSNMTIMSDGFAADLSFGDKAKGYRERFFTENEIRSKTDRDIYNLLMQQTEYSSIANWTSSSRVDPGTTMIYCVAAYGNESNPDGSHKYGPMTMQRVTTPLTTRYADMYPSISYNSTRWTATASKSGTYGTRCAKYYYFWVTEDDLVLELANMFVYSPALLAHKIYKPVIDKNPGEYAVAAQSFYIPLSNSLFFGLWGIDDTNNFSAETTGDVANRSSSGSILQSSRFNTDKVKWEELKRTLSDEKIEEITKSVKVIEFQ